MGESVKPVVVLGGTGYLGRPLIEKLLRDGFQVVAVARPGSERKLPPGCGVITGNALDSATYQDRIPAGSTFVHLVGTPHPSPWKAAEFRSIDLVSLEQSVAAGKRAAAEHFVFVGVAHPAPVMRDFIAVRVECEQKIRQSGLNATIFRPWYILGPGHYWPCILMPLYKVLETIPTTRESAVRLGLVTRARMVNALASAVASDTRGIRVIDTAAIRACEA